MQTAIATVVAGNQRPLIQIERAGRRVLPTQPTEAGFWQLTMGGRVVGWSTSYVAAEAKRQRLENARGLGHA